MTIRKTLAILAAIALSGAPTLAGATEYRADLNGVSTVNRSGSAATASALVSLDTAAQTVAVTIDVHGLTIDALWDVLVDRPAGPIHLHRYAGTDLSDPNSSSLAFPVPFDATYRATADGFSVSTGPRPYAEGAAILGLQASFADLAAAMDAGSIVVNIHTDAFNGGEISGQLVPSAGPAVAPLASNPEPATPTDHSRH